MIQFQKLLQNSSQFIKILQQNSSKNTSTLRNLASVFSKNNHTIVDNHNIDQFHQNSATKKFCIQQQLNNLKKIIKELFNLLACSQQTKTTLKYSQQLNKKINFLFKHSIKLCKNSRTSNQIFKQYIQKYAEQVLQILLFLLLKLKDFSSYKNDQIFIKELINIYLLKYQNIIVQKNNNLCKSAFIRNQHSFIENQKSPANYKMNSNLIKQQNNSLKNSKVVLDKQNSNKQNCFKFSIPYLASRIHNQIIESQQQTLLWYVSQLLLSQSLNQDSFNLMEVYFQEVCKTVIIKKYMNLFKFLTTEGMKRIKNILKNSDIDKYYELFSTQIMKLLQTNHTKQSDQSLINLNIEILKILPQIQCDFQAIFYCQIVEKSARGQNFNLKLLFVILQKIEIFFMSSQKNFSLNFLSQQINNNSHNALYFFRKIAETNFYVLIQIIKNQKKLLDYSEKVEKTPQFKKYIQSIKNINQILLNFLSKISKQLIFKFQNSKQATVVLQQYLSIVYLCLDQTISNIVYENEKNLNISIVPLQNCLIETVWEIIDDIKRFFALGFNILIQIYYFHQNMKLKHQVSQYKHLISCLKKYLTWILSKCINSIQQNQHLKHLRCGFLQILAYFCIPKSANLKSPFNSLYLPHLQSSLLIAHFYQKFSLLAEQRAILLKIVGKLTNQMVNTDVQYLTKSKHSQYEKQLFKKIRKEIIISSYSWIQKGSFGSQLIPMQTTSIKIIPDHKPVQQIESSNNKAKQNQCEYPISPSSQNFQKSNKLKKIFKYNYTQTHLQALCILLRDNFGKIQNLKLSNKIQNKNAHRNKQFELQESNQKINALNIPQLKKIIHQIDYPLRILPQTIDHYHQHISQFYRKKILSFLSMFYKANVQQLSDRASKLASKWLKVTINNFSRQKFLKDIQSFSQWKFFSGKDLNQTIKNIFRCKNKENSEFLKIQNVQYQIQLLSLLKLSNNISISLQACQAINYMIKNQLKNIGQLSISALQNLNNQILYIIFEGMINEKINNMFNEDNQIPQLFLIRHSPQLWFELIISIIIIFQNVQNKKKDIKVKNEKSQKKSKNLIQILLEYFIKSVQYFTLQEQSAQISILASQKLKVIFKKLENYAIVQQKLYLELISIYSKLINKKYNNQYIIKGIQTPCFRSNMNQKEKTQENKKNAICQTDLGHENKMQKQEKFHESQIVYKFKQEELDSSKSDISHNQQISSQVIQLNFQNKVIENISQCIIYLYKNKNKFKENEKNFKINKIANEQLVKSINLILTKNYSLSIISILPFCIQGIQINLINKTLANINYLQQKLLQNGIKNIALDRSLIVDLINGIIEMIKNFNNISLLNQSQEVYFNLILIIQKNVQLLICYISFFQQSIKKNSKKSQIFEFAQALLRQYQALIQNHKFSNKVNIIKKIANFIYQRIPNIVNLSQKITYIQLSNFFIEFYVKIVSICSNLYKLNSKKQQNSQQIINFMREKNNLQDSFLQTNNILLNPPMKYHILKLVLHSPNLIPNKTQYFIRIYQNLWQKQIEIKQLKNYKRSKLLQVQIEINNIYLLFFQTIKNEKDCQITYNLLSYFEDQNIFKFMGKNENQNQQQFSNHPILSLLSNVIPCLCLSILKEKSQIIAQSQKYKIQLNQNYNVQNKQQNIYIQIEKAISVLNKLIQALIESDFFLFHLSPDLYDEYLSINNQIMKQIIQLMLIDKLQINKKIQKLMKNIFNTQNQRFLIQSILQQ